MTAISSQPQCVNDIVWQKNVTHGEFLHSLNYFIICDTELKFSCICASPSWLVHLINSLWPNDAIWWHRPRSTLAQVMACCLMALSHYLNQCWLFISKIQWHSSAGNFTRDTSAINHQNELQNYLPKISLKSPRDQWVKVSNSAIFLLPIICCAPDLSLAFSLFCLRVPLTFLSSASAADDVSISAGSCGSCVWFLLSQLFSMDPFPEINRIKLNSLWPSE